MTLNFKPGTMTLTLEDIKSLLKHSVNPNASVNLVLSYAEEAEREIIRLREKLAWLCTEVERDHELGRLSVDSENCIKACREYLDE